MTKINSNTKFLSYLSHGPYVTFIVYSKNKYNIAVCIYTYMSSDMRFLKLRYFFAEFEFYTIFKRFDL